MFFFATAYPVASWLFDDISNPAVGVTALTARAKENSGAGHKGLQAEQRRG